MSLNLENKAIKNLTTVNYATQIINMDGIVLLPLNGKFYILNSDFEQFKDSLPSSATRTEETPLNAKEQKK